MRGLFILDDAFTADDVAAMRTGALDSPFLGESPLTGTFEATRGFAIAWRRGARDDLESRFPFLKKFLALALDRKMHRRAQRRPLFFPVVDPNAFYLNVLVVPAGAAVERHIDATLSPKSAPDSLIPIAVAVAYAQVPEDLRGGRLLLDNGKGERATVEPKEGRFVMFAGHLAHAVEEVTGPTRISWVLEQYALDAESLQTIPQMRIHSRAGFGAFLEEARRRQPG